MVWLQGRKGGYFGDCKGTEQYSDLNVLNTKNEYEDISPLIQVTANSAYLAYGQYYRVGNEVHLKGCFNFNTNVSANTIIKFGMLPYAPNKDMRLPCVANPHDNYTVYAARCMVGSDGSISFQSGTACREFAVSIDYKLD